MPYYKGPTANGNKIPIQFDPNTGQPMAPCVSPDGEIYLLPIQQAGALMMQQGWSVPMPDGSYATAQNGGMQALQNYYSRLQDNIADRQGTDRDQGSGVNQWQKSVLQALPHLNDNSEDRLKDLLTKLQETYTNGDPELKRLQQQEQATTPQTATNAPNLLSSKQQEPSTFRDPWGNPVNPYTFGATQPSQYQSIMTQGLLGGQPYLDPYGRTVNPYSFGS